MKFLVTIVLLLVSCSANAQPNCNVYKTSVNDSCYRACLEGVEASERQGTRQSQEQFDRAIELCPDFGYAYFEKAVPYLKRGDFVTFEKLMNRAISLNPTQYLGYRGSCRYKLIHDYKGAIRDLELLDSLVESDIGYSHNGNYHLNIVKAFCYKAVGDKKSAIEIIEKQISTPGYSPMLFDYMHLGVLKLETGDTAGAVICLNKSIEVNDYLAENYYYLSLIDMQSGRTEEARVKLVKAKEYYLRGYRRVDPYTHQVDQVYLSDIEEAIDIAGNRVK